MEQKLHIAVKYAVENSKFYAKHFNGADIEDFTNLPFTHKEDIANDNDSFFCVDKSEVAEYVSTSGTSGEPVYVALTNSDLDRLALNEYSSLKRMGFSSDDTFQLLLTLDKQFMAGIAYYSGILKLGACVIRNGPGGLLYQLNSINRFKPTVLIAVPTFILKLIEYSESQGFSLQDSSVKSIICIGEPIHNDNFEFNTIAQSIVDKWDVKLHSTYASTEMATAFYQCPQGKGCHNNDDLLFTEILDENNNHVNEGEQGEIVITTLGVQGTPLIRYKTGDIASYYSSECGCGESSMRIGPIIGRKDQLIKFKGTTIYPQNIFNALNSINIDSYFIQVELEGITTTSLKIYITEESLKGLEIKEITRALNSKLRVTPTIILSQKEDIQNLILKHSKRKKSRIAFTQAH